jgi:hypothetical protein
VAADLAIDRRKLELVLLFQRLTKVISDPDVPNDQVRRRIFEEVPREELHRALDDLHDGLLDDAQSED